jgi:hypothetical protein
MMKSITADAERPMTASPPITPPTIAPAGTDLEFEVEGVVKVEVGGAVDEGKEFEFVAVASDAPEAVYPGGYCVPVEMPNAPV